VSSNDTGNAASLNSSSSLSSNLNLQETEETGLTAGENFAAPICSQAELDEAPTPSPPAAGNWDVTPTPSSPDECIVPDKRFERQNLNSHGTHSVPAQVIARLYSSHFSTTRENVAAESQEIAEIYNLHFLDASYSMPENAIADAEAAAVAIAHNSAAGTTDAVASTNDTVASTDAAVASTDDAVASTDDSVASVNNADIADNADNCDNERDSSYDPDEESYDATYDDRNWRQLQREADAEGNEHYYTRQRRGRPDWGIQDPGWTAPRAPTAHPEAKPPSNHRLQDWNVNYTKLLDKTGYTIKNDDIIYRLPSAPGNTVCYHPPFVPGTLEHQLHRRPLSEQLHVLHQLRDVLLTEEEENGIRERMNPVGASFSLSLNSNDIAVQTERYHESQEQAEYEERLCAALDGDRPRLLVHRHCMCSARAADAANSVPTALCSTLPPLPPFIPFISRLVIRRQSL
jgi:hypothetical protein